jgi:hypothetical protein
MATEKTPNRDTRLVTRTVQRRRGALSFVSGSLTSRAIFRSPRGSGAAAGRLAPETASFVHRHKANRCSARNFDGTRKLLPRPSVLLTSNIVKIFTKLSRGGGVKLLQCYVL